MVRCRRLSQGHRVDGELRMVEWMVGWRRTCVPHELHFPEACARAEHCDGAARDWPTLVDYDDVARDGQCRDGVADCDKIIQHLQGSVRGGRVNQDCASVESLGTV